MRLLAIESSCDDSAIAYLDVNRRGIRRLEHVVASQAIHAKYGGVVPEVAAREHATTMPFLLDAIAEKVIGSTDGRRLGRVVDVVAATRGPGLITSLKVGLDTAKALTAAWNKKFIGVNHIAGHIYSNWLPGAALDRAYDKQYPLSEAERSRRGSNGASVKGLFPALVLVVSGGHTELLLMRGHGKFKLLGATLDDAAGEAFDKTAKLMGLGYPGGPQLSKLAAAGNPKVYDFPRPLLHEKNDAFSFAGLKTSVRYFLREHEEQLTDEKFRADVAASTEQAIVDVLKKKTVRAAERLGVKTILLAGGVAANSKLRTELGELLAERLPKARLVLPPLKYCTDNAAMIAVAAYFRAETGHFDDWRRADADAGWELGRSS
ncbi:MAG: tRNA (adenosine(37)-N6)-threonylcarbamoyltransferase complex transferase subunit TsaD [Patescibacteria group bacterium]|nr:tRNA (adenosine(37)-N6)-threonylcarbamoyltransferase complex transferase subunit TsaD [Patescibacteria group bacterium]